jgi:hypothetical protein
MASTLGRPTGLARRAVVEHPPDLGRSSSRCCGPFGQAIWSPVSSPRSKPPLSVTKVRTQADRCRSMSARSKSVGRPYEIRPRSIWNSYALVGTDRFRGARGSVLASANRFVDRTASTPLTSRHSYGAGTAQRFGMGCEHETRTRRSTKSDSRMDVTSARQAANSGAGCGVCIESR